MYKLLKAAAVALLCPLSLPAQTTTNLGGSCDPWTVLDVFGTPSAGSQIALAVGPNGGIPLVAIGFSDPATPFPSCGCTLHASLDIVCPNGVSLALPANSAGLTFYVQGIRVAPYPVLSFTPCTELTPALWFGLTPGFAITVQ